MDEADGFRSRLGKAQSNEGIAQVLKDAGVSNIPTFGGAQPGTTAKTERRFGSLRAKKHRAADGVAYDPQLATVKVGRVAVDARIERLGAEEKAHVMRLALFLGDRFGEQVRILFDDDAGSASADPTIVGHHTISVNPQALAWHAKDLGKDANLWLKRLGFEEVAHLATFRQIRADLDKSLGQKSTASEFHDHLEERLQAIAGSMTAEQKAWVKDNYGQPLGAQNLASEYLRMLVQVGRQMGGDHGAGLTEAAWMETQTPSAEVRSWLRQMVDAMKKMLRVKPDPQLRPLATGIDKLLLQMEKAAKKGTAVESASRLSSALFDLVRRPDAELDQLAKKGVLGPFQDPHEMVDAVASGERLLGYVEDGEIKGTRRWRMRKKWAWRYSGAVLPQLHRRKRMFSQRRTPPRPGSASRL